MAVTLICSFPSWWDLQRGSRAVDGWDFGSFHADREGWKEANIEKSHLEYNNHGKDRIMDTKPRRLLDFCSCGSHQDRRDGLGGHMDRQLTLNRLDVIHRRIFDSYLQAPGPACQSASSRSYDSPGMPIPTSQLNSKMPDPAQANFVYGTHVYSQTLMGLQMPLLFDAR